MTDPRPTVLLTGASGVLGRALLDELAGDFDVVALRHRSPIGDPRVREAQGDLSEPGLGIDAGTRREIGEVDAVLHCAASTNWRLRPEKIRRTNQLGTEHAIEFARSSGAPLYHMSTAFVARPPDEDVPLTGVTAYVRSKIDAEEQVRASGHPAVILRPSVVLGNSADGYISALQGIHKVVVATLKNELPVLPADPGSTIDCIPQDVVCRATGRVLRSGITEGEFWLTAGDAAPTLDSMVNDTILAVADELGLETTAPRLIPVEAVDRLLVPLMEGVMPRAVRLQFTAFSELMMMFQNEAPLPSSMASLAPDLAMSQAETLEAFRRTVEFCAVHSGFASSDSFSREAAA